jgi:uncharacterized protein with HEPN domain
MRENDRIRIQHIIDASEEALSFVNKVERADFSKNRMLILSELKKLKLLVKQPLRYPRKPNQNIPTFRGKIL